jgi:hypothetical protein
MLSVAKHLNVSRKAKSRSFASLRMTRRAADSVTDPRRAGEAVSRAYDITRDMAHRSIHARVELSNLADLGRSDLKVNEESL